MKFSMRFSVFSYSSSFPIKTHATDAKTQKIEPDPNFFWRTKVSEAVCKCIDTTWGRIYFLKCENFGRKFRTQCAGPLLLGFGILSRILFLGIDVLHMSTKFRTCLWNSSRDIWNLNLIGDILPHPLLKPKSDVIFRHFWCVCKV